MRILYVLNSLGMGGAERQVLALAARMESRGHIVAMLILRPIVQDEWPTATPVLRLGLRKNPFSLIATMLRARHALRVFKPDIVHSHSFHANIFARLLCFSVPRTPTISTVHNIYEGGRARMLAYRLTDRLAHRTTAVSTAAAEQFIRRSAISRARCIVITNGIDTAEFSPDIACREQTRADGNVTGEFIWLTASRLTPAKDIPSLLRAFALVSQAHPHAQLWIAGAVMPSSSLAIGHTHDSFLRSRVKWLGLRRDMPALMDAADAFVLASAWEGMPLVIGEAMAMAKPVVATDVGGVHELIAEQGTVVQPRNHEALAAAMIAVMRTSADGRLQQAQAARRRIEHTFSINAKADEWESLYRSSILERGQ